MARITCEAAEAMKPEGWSHTGYDAPYYLYQKETRDHMGMPVYREMRLIAEDMTVRNVAFMAQHNLTR